MSQFERALKELGVEVIHALSPQAKGRIERLFGVLQDRLSGDALREIKTKEEANAFLEEYLPRYDKRFRVCPANETDAHVKLPHHIDLDKYLCIKTERTIRNDNTIALNGGLYQIEERGGKKVVVVEKLDGSLHMISTGVSLKYKEITERPKKAAASKTDLRVTTGHRNLRKIIHGKGDGKSEIQLLNKEHMRIDQIGHFYFGDRHFYCGLTTLSFPLTSPARFTNLTPARGKRSGNDDRVDATAASAATGNRIFRWSGNGRGCFFGG